MSSTINLHLADLLDRTAGEVVTVRGKELPADATVAEGRAIFASGSVRLIPLLDGEAYAGAVGRDDLEDADPSSITVPVILALAIFSAGIIWLVLRH